MNLKEDYSLCALTFYMMHTFAAEPLQTRKLDLYHWHDEDMVTELRTEQVGTSAVLVLDKASVSTRS
jgi:hypothetical protein